MPLGSAGRDPEAGSKARTLTLDTPAATTKAGAEIARRPQTPEGVAAIDPPLEPSPFQLGAPTEDRFQPPVAAAAAAVEAEASTDASSDEAGSRVETAGAPAWRKVHSSPALYSQTSREVSDMNSELAEMELEAAVQQREARPSRTWAAEAPAGAADALESLRHGGGRARAWAQKDGGAGGRGVTGQVSAPAMEREAEEERLSLPVYAIRRHARAGFRPSENLPSTSALQRKTTVTSIKRARVDLRRSCS